MRRALILAALLMQGCALQLPRECPPGKVPVEIRSDRGPQALWCSKPD